MEFLLFLSVLVTLGVIFVGRYHWSRRKLYLFAGKVSGPLAFPFVGNGLKFLCRKEDILNVFINETDQYPSPVRLWVGPKLILVVKDPTQMQIILQSSKIATKAFVYEFLEPFLGKGLFTANGLYHKTQRRLLQPLFSQRLIDGYSHIFQKHANKFVKQIEKHVGGPEFDISYYLHDSAFESTMDLMLEDKNDHSLDYKDVPQFVRRFYNIVFTRVRNFWFHFDFIYEKSSYFREQLMMRRLADTMIKEILDTRVPEVVQRIKNNEKPEDDRSPSMLESIQEMLQENPDCFSEKECIDHLMTFMATSQDTQSSAIAFTFMMLGAYPEIQDLVVQELREVLGQRTSLDFTDVTKLKYLEMCIKEAMRLYPVAPFIFRETTEEFQLENLIIPENVTVTLSIYHVHRDPKCWEKPNEYYPEHFSAEATTKRNPYAFIPFSAGPRKCIAQQYSYANMKILLSTVLLNYEIFCQQKVEDIQLTTDISIRPLGGYMIKIKPRSL
ncbi:hypothetical protein Zmor_000304 [Zophobas morio]|uniref:Cytochrome P450 n=1 Tax=Zophobas morio TaxID=2755281 RepID=A0AA38MNG2_9CUCU|nr:hypothetical protein Zmor_000304 [Zophobas morio]